jgi:hypothetical protein
MAIACRIDSIDWLILRALGHRRARFDWDENKAKLNVKNHKIDFEEATTVFGDTLSLTIPNPLHSMEEERFMNHIDKTY